jgi:hypothetical protein
MEGTLILMIEISPKKKGIIVTAIRSEGEWIGRIDGHRVKLTKVLNMPSGQQIHYDMVFKRKRYDGYAGTVWEGIDTVCGKIATLKYEQRLG